MVARSAGITKRRRRKNNMDQGHQNLVYDLRALYLDAENQHFHDSDSDFAMPKIYLVNRLQALIDNVKSGRYDN